MPDIELKRQQVIDAYSGDSWRAKVKLMSESQVLALYFRLKSQGRIK